MTRFVEFIALLAAALGIHASALHFLPLSDGLTLSAGEQGQESISVMPADSTMQAMIAEWQRPPVLETQAPVFELPSEIATPILRPAPDIAPKHNRSSGTIPTLNEPDDAPTISDTPPLPVPATGKAKPQKPKAKAPDQPEPPQQKAKGSGGGATAGAAQKAATAASNQPGAARQNAAWGAAIRARIERRKNYPTAANGAKGKVVLKLRVAADGRLIQLGIAKSSGNAALDNAALDAVKSAGRFPAAPNGISSDIGFTLPMTFNP